MQAKTTPIGTAYRVKGQRGEVLEWAVCTGRAGANDFRAKWKGAGGVSVRTFARTIKAGGYEVDVIVCYAVSRIWITGAEVSR